MPLAAGTRLGTYEISAVLGSGGMGEVYRARDARLGRDVAIKVLPEGVAADPERLARFEREAQAVAALSHPNILAIFEFGTHDTRPFVAMELLEGETLRDRLAAGPLPVRKAVDIAIQVARGLGAAHSKSLIHRDLKPENVFLLTDGQVKILDFGLARVAATDPSSGARAASETRMALTGEGTILGTVAYMAPEQIKGGELDARTDLFALGAVLHEMLTGAPAFRRETPAETMTAILRDEPADLANRRSDVPPALVRIVHHALEKNPAERFQTARDVAFALEGLSGSGRVPAGVRESGTRDETGAQPVAGSFRRERTLWMAVTAGLAVLAGWLAIGPPRGDRPAPAVRASIPLPVGTAFRPSMPSARRLAISPDGRRVAFIVEPRGGGGETTLYVHSLDAGTQVAIPDTAGARGPFWSPDSRTLAFFQKDRLMVVEGAGRPTQRLALPGGVLGAWSPTGDIVAITGPRSVVLVSPGATEPRELNVAPDADQLMGSVTWLPDGRRFLLSTGSVPKAMAGVYRADTSGAAAERVFDIQIDRDASTLTCVDGFLVGVRDQMAVARPVDADGALRGETIVTLGGPVDSATRGGAAIAVSSRVLVYQPVRAADLTRLLWYDRSGARLSQVAEEARYSNLEASRDGANLLVGILDPAVRARDIWVIDLRRGLRSRVTSDPVDERSAVWTADGRGVIHRGTNGDLFTRPLGGGDGQPVQVDGTSKDPRPLSPDGRFLMYRQSGFGTGNDLWIKPLSPPGEARPFLATPFNESHAEISPDGKWVAYVSDEAGQADVYVTAFPSGSGKTIISSGGGDVPRWRADGRELFYLSLDRVLMAVAVRSSAAAFEPDAPKPLFRTEADRGPGPQFIVSPDGQRFLINSEVPTGEPATLAVIVNWQSLVSRR